MDTLPPLNQFITTKDAGILSGYTSDYLSKLARSGEIRGRRVGRAWFIERDSLLAFLSEQGNRKSEYARTLAREREKEYRSARSPLARAGRALRRAAPLLEPGSGLAAGGVRSHAIALAIALAVVASGAALARASFIPNLADTIGSLAATAAAGFDETFGALPSRFVARVTDARMQTLATNARVGTAVARMTAQLAGTSVLASPDLSFARMRFSDVSSEAPAAAAEQPTQPRYAEMTLPLADATASLVGAYGFVSSPPRVGAVLVGAYRAVGESAYGAIVSALDGYQRLVVRAGVGALALGASVRDTLADAPHSIMAAGLVLGRTVALTAHSAIDADVSLAYGLSAAAPATARVTVAFVGDTGAALAAATARAPTLATDAFLAVASAPARIAPKLAEAVFGAEYAAAARFLAATGSVQREYLALLDGSIRAAGAGFAGAADFSRRAAPAVAELPRHLEDAYLAALGKAALALGPLARSLQSAAQVPQIAAALSATAPALSAGERAALFTYETLHGLFTSTTGALAALFAPAPGGAPPAAPPAPIASATTTPEVATSSPAALAPSYVAVTNYPTYTTVVQGADKNYVDQSVSSLNAALIARINDALRPIASQVSTNITTIQEVNRIQSLADLTVTNGTFNGGTLDSGNVTNAGTVTSKNASFTTLSSTGATSLGATTITGTVNAADLIKAPYFVATSTTATSTFAGSLAVDTNGLVYATSTKNVGIGVLSPAALLAVANSASSQPIFTAANAAGTEVYRLTDAGFVGIGSTSPTYALSVEGSSSLGTQAIAGFVSATSTTATSTFAGRFAVGTTTPFGNGLFTLGTSSPLLYVDSTTGYVGIGSSSPAQLLSVAGTGYFTGGLGVGAATSTPGDLRVSGNAYVGGSLTVVGNNTILGNSSTNTLTINSSINSSIVPNQNVTYNLGSPSFYWNNAYVGTLTANNISAASTTIGGTQSSTFTINSDNASADQESQSLIFFRGTVVPNAILSWNAATSSKRFEFNQPLYIQNQSGSTTQTTLSLQGVAGQTGSIFNIASSSGTSLFSISSDGTTSVGGALTVNGSLTSTLQASTTLFSSLGPAYFGTTATTTIDSAGNLSVAGTLSATAGLSTLSNLLATGSSTLQNFTFVSATGTAATTTSFFATTASSTNLFATSGALGSLSLSSALPVSSGGTGATSFTASSLLYGAGTGALQSIATSSLSLGSSLSYSGTLGALVGGVGGSLSLNTANANSWTALQQFSAASSTLLSAYGPAYFGATATSTFGTNGSLTLAGPLTYGGVALNNAVTGTGNLVLSASPTLTGTLSASAASFSGLASFANASSTLLSVFNKAYFGATATSTFDSAGNLSVAGTLSATAGLSTLSNLLATGSSTLQNFTFVSATGTAATTTSLFATTASSTNLFAQTASVGTLAVSGATTLASSLSGLLQGASGVLSAVTGTAGQFPYYNGTNTLAATSSVFLATSGNVGVGSTTPATTLSVGGSGYLTGGLGVGVLNTTSGTLQTSGNITGGGALALSGTTGTTTIASGQGFTIGSSQFVLQQGSGNVGIGTASPAWALDILRNTTSQARVNLVNSNSGSAAYTAYVVGNDSFSTLGGFFGNSSGNTTFAGANSVNLVNTQAASLGLGTNNSVNLVINSSGNVGIGTTTNSVFDQVGAARPLLVASNSSNTTVGGSTNTLTISNLDTTTNNSSDIAFAASSGSSINQYVDSEIVGIHGARTNGQYTSGQLAFMTAPGGNVSPIERMRIDSSGNVGIGTTTPGALLDVFGGSSNLPASSGTTVNGQFRVAGSNVGIEMGTYSVLSSSGWIQVHDKTNQATNYSLLLNPNGGNVGIGTTTPDNKLTVSADSGSVTASIETRAAAAAGLYFKTLGRDTWLIGNSLTTANTFQLYDSTAAAARLTVDSSGAVAIPGAITTGTNSSGSQALILSGAASDAAIKFKLPGDTASQLAGFTWANNSGTTVANDWMTGDASAGIRRFQLAGTGSFDFNNNTIAIAANTPTFRIQGVSGSTNFVTVSGSNGSAPGFTTNAGDLNLYSGSGSVAFGEGQSTNYVKIAGGGGGNPTLSTNGGNLVITPGGGLVGIGSSPSYQLDVQGSQSASYIARVYNSANSTTAHGMLVQAGSNSGTGATLVGFLRPDGTAIGSINENSITTVAYNTTSDRRLKENIATSGTGLATLLQIPVDDFNFISDPNKAQVQGFIAQDLYQYYPEAVATNGDNGAVPLSASSTPWQVDYGRVTPLIARALQQMGAAINVTGALTGTSTLQSLYQGTTTPAIYVDAAGNVGIGTNTPTHTLQVAGDVGAIAFVNTSTRSAKTDITYLSSGQADAMLKELKQLKPATYLYKIESQNDPLRLGLIAEDASTTAPEILSPDGKGVDIYKLATFTLAGVQALAAKVDANTTRLTSLEARVAALESGAISVASGSPVSFSTSTLASALSGFGVLIQKGFAQFGTIIADQFVAATNSAGTSSAGTVTILAGNTVAQVNNAYVLPTSKIFVTFTASTTGSWWVSDKTAGSFRVVFSAPQTADVSFDYFIVQTEGQIATSTPDGSFLGAPSVSQSNGPDTVPPVITLLGDNPMHVSVGAAFADPGIEVTDAVDGTDPVTTFINGIEQPVSTTTIDTASPTTYLVTYRAMDRAGNVATAIRSIIVGNPDGTVSTGSATTTTAASGSGGAASTTPPVVTLNGDAAMQIAVGAVFTDPGATAVDSSGSDITASITETGSVDTATEGLYTLTYAATDAAGNTGNASRVVSVAAPASSTTTTASTTTTSSSSTDSSTASTTTATSTTP